MAFPSPSTPLYEKMSLKKDAKRAVEIFILFLLVSLLGYRLAHLKDHGLEWQVALACESWFAFVWVLVISTKWSPVSYKTYPQRILQRVTELPPVDIFVTTADPQLEPPIITVNTVLSLMAVNYPAHKLACYVSDDGCSPLTFYSLVEAAKFAKLWVPFCKKYDIQLRAPSRYFAGNAAALSGEDCSSEFQQARDTMRDEYEKLSRKIEDASQGSVPSDFTGELAAFAKAERGDHPSIIKIILENKEGRPDELPHLIYISREKRPKHPHHYKAGAMNVLTRVSGLMTNAPFMLNVDCDMHANNPQIVLHALCLLLGAKHERDCAFVQCPQIFYDALKDDPFGNQMVVLFEYLGRGIVGIQGPFYAGTGCFHRRKVIYGLWPDDTKTKNSGLTSNGEVTKERSLNGFGSAKQFINSAAHALRGNSDHPKDLLSSLEAAIQVASCTYEHNTDWGKKIGWMYGSATEDILTGLTIQSKGWRSLYCSPNPPAFLGCAPSGGPASMTQQKRWATGLLEVLASNKSPIYGTLFGQLHFRQCLGYLWLLTWALRSIPEFLYALLPAYCIMTNSHFLPKGQEPAILIPAAIFIIYNLYCLSEYLMTGLSMRAWWNNQRMQRITSACAWSFGVLSVVLKLLGLSETVFEVTKKDQSASSDGTGTELGRFTFDESPIFVPGTALLLVHLTAIVAMLLGLRPQASGNNGSGLGEVVCTVWVVLCFWPFFRGLFGKGKYGIPSTTIVKGAILAIAVVCLSRFTSTS
ncbi:cellulose synthase-like protein H1 isoform X3 [Rhodamnia argentea]|uniref:Cellulose synthase-like protein H1 isoform X3 n=1 Tax=Rhodamnia argentea TaxID=178133 RepID=A0A8B8QCV7_9MYRT|nr:cellulose synthase-like protein H1 isoform X3 [Rhodamnia argentea]